MGDDNDGYWLWVVERICQPGTTISIDEAGVPTVNGKSWFFGETIIGLQLAFGCSRLGYDEWRATKDSVGPASEVAE